MAQVESLLLTLEPTRHHEAEDDKSPSITSPPHSAVEASGLSKILALPLRNSYSYLDQLQLSHVYDLLPILDPANDGEDGPNTRLYKQVYGSRGRNPLAFRDALFGCDGDPDVLTFAIMSADTHKPLGWLRLELQGRVVVAAVFLPRKARVEWSLKVTSLLGQALFEKGLSCEMMEYWIGTFGSQDKRTQENYCFSLVSALRRVNFVKDRSAEADLYVITAGQWPAVNGAVAAWLATTTPETT